jgi:hypothetical protein
MRLRLEALAAQGRFVESYRRHKISDNTWEFILSDNDDEISSICVKLTVHGLIRLDGELQKAGMRLKN